VIVVSNSSPIMNLAVVGQVHLLERLYGKVYIPEVERPLNDQKEREILDQKLTELALLAKNSALKLR
jgi:predicted nucleic acid-binding protein